MRSLCRDLPPDQAHAVEASARGAFAPTCNLAHGDFAAVRRRVRATTRSYSVQELIELVLEEARTKSDTRARVGFG